MAKFVEQAVELDKFDCEILNLVQRNAERTHAEIGNQVGLSTSAVRRRIQRLKDAAILGPEIALVDVDQFGVTLVVDVTFNAETPELYAAFDQLMTELSEVQQSYHVAGDTDYVLVVHAPSLQWYEEWSKQTLMSHPDIKRASSRVVWSRKKFVPSVRFPRSR